MSETEKQPIAVQANSLVSARYRLTLGEQRMILMMISKIGYNDEAFQGYEISIKEFAAIMQINEDCAYREAHAITDRLLKRILRLPQADGSLTKCCWIAEVNHRPGSVTLIPAPSLKPYLLKLRENFTITPIQQVGELRSQYSVRIYMLLRQYSSLGKFELGVDEFRAMLGLEDQYPRFNALRSWVLDAARQELREKSDMYFNLETLKKGKTIVILKFIIVNNKKKLAEPAKGSMGQAAEKAVNALIKQNPPAKRWHFPEHWNEFLEYCKKNDPGLLPIIDSDGPETGIVKYPYRKWLDEVFGR